MAEKTPDILSDTGALRIDEARRDPKPHLDLSNLGLASLPESIGQLTHLETLDLRNNQIMWLPHSLGELTNLRSLDLSGNRLSERQVILPPNLIELNLSGNTLTALPKSMGELQHLIELNVAGNELSTLPEWIGQLSALTKLDASCSELKDLPASIANLSKLQILILWGTKLKVFPESIVLLTDLRNLAFSYSRVGVLPESLAQLINLNRLSIVGDELTALPASIGDLTNLKYLSDSHNLLQSLPLSVERLTNLVQLDIASNKLTSLPAGLCELPRLTELYLHDNNQLGLPAEVLGPTPSGRSGRFPPARPGDILDYYFRTGNQQRPLNEAKLILVGRGGVGKTSIVNRLVANVFADDEKKTEGIKITEWKIKLNGSEDVRLIIWDFGGQEIMHATHQFFLTQRSLYLVVVTGREGGEDSDAEYWLKLVESFGGESPVILVLNKIKDHAFDVNRRALEQKYPAIRDFIKTDCADGTGIKELLTTVERETDRLKHLRDAFPASWFDIKDRLAGMKKNYLSYEEYCSFCDQQGETDRNAQKALAGYLHSLGIVLNYIDDPRLQDTHVLSPHWVTNGIYKILNSDKLEMQRGEIALTDAAQILEEREYPSNMRRFLFDLMKKFELCFSFPGNDTRFLIPELLDKQEPDETGRFAPNECLSFQYHYPILPEGLLPRFIVRTHALSEGLQRWRTGVIVKFEGCLGLVKADVHDRKVFILVSGPSANRRRLLAVIRSDFEHIHRDIRHLQPTEMVPVARHPELVVPYKKLQVMEKSGVRRFIEVFGDKVIELDVQDLLSGVDVEGFTRTESMSGERNNALRLFYCYSHKDESLRNELETHLKLLQRLGLIDSWSDRKIEAGADWKHSISENLINADVILLLVSADFIASDYCYEKEMQWSLNRHAAGKATVIPVIVRDVNWSKAPFANLQTLPKEGLAVTKWEDRDSAWRNVSEGIERVVEKLRSK